MWKPDIERIVEAAQHAPSIFNSQPWSFRICADDRIELRANLGGKDGVDRGHWDQWLSPSGQFHPDPLAREFVISCGAALFNLRLAIRVAGHDLTVWPLPDHGRDSTLLATIEIATNRIEPPTNEEQELYEAIWRRRTNRWPNTIVRAPMPIIISMEHVVSKWEGVSLRVVKKCQARKWMRMVDQADRDLASEPPDLLPVTHSRYSLYREQRDNLTGHENHEVGVSTENYGPPPANHYPQTLSRYLWPRNRYPRTRKDFWRGDEMPYERNPRLLALSTTDDEPLDWLRAGQALQHAILTGTRYSRSAPYGLAAKYHASRRYGLPARHRFFTRPDDLAKYGLSVSFLTQPLERYDIEREDNNAKPRHWPWRWRFPELPQMVLRVGYAPVETPAALHLDPEMITTIDYPRAES